MNDRRSLKDLVELAIQRHQTSGRQLSFLAQDQGFRLTVTTINHIRGGTYKSTPTPDTLRALAWLAGVEDDVAFAAAGQPVPGPPFADELPPGVDNLSPKARKAIIEVLRVLVEEQEKERGGNVSTAPITQAGESPAASDTDTTQDDVDLAAYDTGQESQGRRLRRLQDEAAEAGDGA